MSDTPPDEPAVHPLDNPETRWRTVKALLITAPFIFVGCYLLAWVQGAELRVSVLIAAVGAAMSLGAALAIHVMGSKSWMALVALKLALLFVKR